MWQFVFCNICIFIFSYAICALCLGRAERSRADILLYMFVIHVAVILVITFILGFIFEAYSISNIIFVCAALLAVSLLAAVKRRIAVPRFQPLVQDLRRLKGLKAFEKLVFLVIAATLVFKLTSIFLLRVYDWDGLSYHLPNLVDYIQNQKITLVEKSLWSNVYPRNIEMLNMWALVFRRDALLIKLPQFVITVMGGAAVYHILQLMQLRRKNCLLGMLFFLSVPVVLAQMSTVYIDSSLAVFLLLCIYFMLQYVKQASMVQAIILGVTLGICFGIKYSAAAYVAILASAFMVISLRKCGVRKGLSHIAAAGIVALGMGCVWYVFNWIYLGDPFAPFEIKIGSFILFSGESMQELVMLPNVPASLQGKNMPLQVLMSWLEFLPKDMAMLSDRFGLDTLANLLTTTYDERMGGFGINWLFIMLPSLGIITYKVIKEKKINTSLCLVLLVPMLFFWVTPEKWWCRYTIALILAGIYAYLYLLENYKIPKWVHGLFLVVMCFNCAAGSGEDLFRLYTGMEGGAASLSSFRERQYPDDFTREMAPYINNKPNKIVTFLPIVDDIFCFAGNDTQNTVKLYVPGNSYAMGIEGFNILAQQVWFDYILDFEKPDFIFFQDGYHVEYQNFFAVYNAEQQYNLVYAERGKLVYKRKD